MGSIPSIGLDQYQRTAQLYPAILAVSPLLAVAIVWAPKALGVVGSVGSVGVIAALSIFLIQIGRQLGRAVEARWALGPPVTIAALRHGGSLLSPATLARYHAALRQHGIAVPSSEEQANDPVGADSAYADLVVWLRDQTRDQKRYSLIHVENRNYGFRRNLLGLKSIGVVICGTAVALDLWLILTAHAKGDLQIAAWILLGVLTAGLGSWGLVVTREFVLDASRAYAVRLLAASDMITAVRAGKRTRNSPGEKG